MHDDAYTDAQYNASPVVGMYFGSVESTFTFYKEHNRVTDFGIVKKTSRKIGGEIKFVTIRCNKRRKPKARNKSKRVDCKAKELSNDA